MRCSACGAIPVESATFCTACGAGPLVERDENAGSLGEREVEEPFAVGHWAQDAARSSGTPTEPILDMPLPSVAGLPSPRRPVLPPHPPTPVKQMVGEERDEWLSSVWGQTLEAHP